MFGRKSDADLMRLEMWTEEASREFLSTYFPWFLETYDGYPYPVQRVDTVKYFLLLHYGGIYLDMDNVRCPFPAAPAPQSVLSTILTLSPSQGCLTNLTPLLYYPTWTTDGGRGALSNNILGSAPKHPFWHFLTDSLIPYSYNYISPYITISYASGQWFETAVWDAYHAALPKASPDFLGENRLHRVMMDDRPGNPPWIYFTQMRGGSWRNWDNAVFLWVGDHLILLVLCVCALVALACWVGTRCLARLRRRRWHVNGNLSRCRGSPLVSEQRAPGHNTIHYQWQASPTV